MRAIRWARLLMNKAPLIYPQVDTTKPVTMSVLVLPADADFAHRFNGEVSQITNSTPLCSSGNVTMGVTVTGSGSYTYLWSDAGGQLPSETARTMTVPVVSINPPYTVTVSDGTCPVTTPALNLNASVQAVTITSISGTTITYEGGNGCTFHLLKSTDITLPLASWTEIATSTCPARIVHHPDRGHRHAGVLPHLGY